MHIELRHLKIIQNILNKYPYIFYIFGSRATGLNLKPLSDLDLCYKQEIPQQILLRIEESFEESDLPYKVDLVNWNECNNEFKEIIKKDMKVFQLK